nr:DUF6760 family protein [Halobium salinum]
MTPTAARQPGTPLSDGGSVGYPLDRLYEEVAFVAYHFNWSRGDVLNMPHWERQRWCAEISAINERINEERE